MTVDYATPMGSSVTLTLEPGGKVARWRVRVSRYSGDLVEWVDRKVDPTIVPGWLSVQDKAACDQVAASLERRLMDLDKTREMGG